MPLQNRVNPEGTIFRTSARGTMMGNRGGVLHRDREIVREYKSRRWIACVLEFKERRRVVMSEGRYTELFFLDEAVAFAAGHRPCAECRRKRFNEFRDAWRLSKSRDRRPTADEMDLELHAARIEAQAGKVTHQAPLGSLPDGCLVRLDESPWLVRGDSLFLWSPEGYSTRSTHHTQAVVTVLTPEPVVNCFRQGYQPEMHHSCRE